MYKKRGVTLKDLAQKMGISVSTVSRALNDHPDISSETKKLVRQHAKALNYYPNLYAKGFRTHRTHTIGVVVPKISHYFTSTTIEGILDEAEVLGYRAIVSESKNDPVKQTEMLNTMLQFGVDGILLSLTKKTRNVQDLLKVLDRIPLVLFDKGSTKIPCTQVIINDEEAAYKAVKHLINIGKKRIAIFKEIETSFNSERRFEGYIRALKKHNLPIDPDLILSTEDISVHEGKRMTNRILSLQEKPDAIFAITDASAIGVIKTLKKFQIKIPEEIAVVGFSNSFSSTIISPKLSTIDQPGHKIGKTAVKYLIDEIENDTDENVSFKTVEIQTNLIVRDSSLKVGNFKGINS